MQPYAFTVAHTLRAATNHTAIDTVFLAGGTTLVDLMKLQVLTPGRVVDINGLPMTGITADPVGLRIGALERKTAVAEHPAVRRDFALISQALELSASPQLHNMASMGGTFCSAPDAATFVTRRCRVTNATPDRAARR